MKTDRTSFSVAASPASLRDDLDRHAERAEQIRERACAVSGNERRVPSPRAGTGPSNATSAKPTPASAASAASSRLSAGEAVFRSA